MILPVGTLKSLNPFCVVFVHFGTQQVQTIFNLSKHITVVKQ
jgi:hypothetical protein